MMPGAADGQIPSLADLVEALQRAEFPVGTAETIDAAALLVAMAGRGENVDGIRLRSRLRPVFCKSREQQQRFDGIFDEWWASPVAPDPPSPPPLPPPIPLLTDPPPRRVARYASASAALLVLLGAAYVLSTRARPPAAGPLATAATQVSPPPSTAPSASAPPVSSPIDRYVASARFGVEARTWWLWSIAVVPLAALLGVTLPALVLSRTRSGRRFDPIVLDPGELSRQARSLVPKLPDDVADRLSRHVRSRGINIARETRRPSLDVRRTLEATLRNRGIPTLKFSVARVHPTYLILIDVANETDPRGRLFYQWAERLQREGLGVELSLLRCSHGGDGVERIRTAPIESRPGVEPTWSELSALRGPRFGERLIVISDGKALVGDNGAWRSDAVRARFHRWPDRALFTPVEPRDWDTREADIEAPERPSDPGFIVLPLEESALRAWLDLVITGELSSIRLSDPQRYPRLLRHGGDPSVLGDVAPDVETLERLIDQLRMYLGDRGFMWLAGIAVIPVVRWELTLLVGRHVLRQVPQLNDDSRRLSAALARNYRRLVRLPWIQRQSIPDWLRLRLLMELSSAQDRQLRESIRTMLAPLVPRDVRNPIEVDVERAAGRDRDAGADPLGNAAADTLFLGFMSGLSAEQLVLRMPGTWESWAREVRVLRRRRRGLWSPLRARVHASWARWIWRGGLPHAGINRRRMALLTALLLPAVLAGAAGVAYAPPSPLVTPTWFFAERVRESVLFEPNVTALIVNADGSRIATGTGSGAVHVWITRTGERLWQARAAHNGPVSSLAFTADGTRLASGGEDGALRVWDLARAEIGQTRAASSGAVSAVAFDNAGAFVATGGTDGVVRTWNVNGGASVAEVEGFGFGPIRALTFAANLLVSEYESARIRTIVVAPGGLLGAVLPSAFPGTPPPQLSRWAAWGGLSAFGRPDGTIELWLSSRTAATPLAAHTESISDLIFTPGGNRLISSGDRFIRIWDTSNGAPVGQPLAGHTARVTALASSRNGELIVSASDDGTVRIWDARPGVPAARLEGHAGLVSAIAFQPGGRLLVSGGSDNIVRVWDVQTGHAVGDPLDAHTAPVTGLAFSHDGAFFASSSADFTVRVWDSTTRGLIRTLAGHNGTVGGLAISSDGRIITHGSDSTVRVWNASSGAQIATLNVDAMPLAVAVSPDGNRIAVATSDTSIRLWDVQMYPVPTGAMRRHTGWPVAMSFSPDSSLLASIGAEGFLCLWDAVSGAAIDQCVEAHVQGTSLAFSPDGQAIATSGLDGTIRLWNVARRQPIGSPLVSSGQVGQLAFGATGFDLAAATSAPQVSRPAAVELWRVSLGAGDESARVASVRRALENWAGRIPGRTLALWAAGVLVALVTVWLVALTRRISRAVERSRQPA